MPWTGAAIGIDVSRGKLSQAPLEGFVWSRCSQCLPKHGRLARSSHAFPQVRAALRHRHLLALRRQTSWQGVDGRLRIVAELNSTPDWMLSFQAGSCSLVCTIALTSVIPLLTAMKGKVTKMKLTISLRATWKVIAPAISSTIGALWSVARSG